MFSNLVNIVVIMGVGMGFFLIGLLINKSKIIYANRILALILLFSVFQLINFFLLSNNLNKLFPKLLLFFSTATLILGPLHFLYAKFLINSNKKFNWFDNFYFLLFYIANIFFLPLYFSEINKAYSFYYENQLFFIILIYVSLVQSIVFMILTLKILKSSLKAIKNSYATIEKVNLSWLKTITLLVLIFISVLFLFLIIDSFYSLPAYLNPGSISAILLFVLIYIAGFLGLKQPKIILVPIEKSSKKYQTSGLNEEQAHLIELRLIELMQQEKPYLNNELTIAKLAEMLSISTAYLSQVINENLGRNFYEFINYHRVKEVKKRLADPKYENLTILAIAYDVGFNSKSTFNSIFKKYLQMTPSQYQKSIKK